MTTYTTRSEPRTYNHTAPDTAGKTMPIPPKGSRLPRRDANGKSLPAGACPPCERCTMRDAFRDCDGHALCAPYIFDIAFPGRLPNDSPCTAPNITRRAEERAQPDRATAVRAVATATRARRATSTLATLPVRPTVRCDVCGSTTRRKPHRDGSYGRCPVEGCPGALSRVPTRDQDNARRRAGTRQGPVAA